MREVSYKEAWSKKYPEQIALVTSVDKHGKPNVLPLGWCMCTSFQPPMLAISVGKTRYSHKLLSEWGEFVVAFPTEDMKKEVLYCGSHSGRDVDKFKESGLKPVRAKKVKPPLITGCIANMECKVVGKLDSGDHTIFVGEIVASHIEDIEKRRLYSLGNNRYGGL